MMKFSDREGNPISIGTVVGRGGEAVVYRIIGRPTWLAKIYEPAPRPYYAAKLAWMLEHPPANPTHPLDHPSLAWPAGLLYGQGNRLAGYLVAELKSQAGTETDLDRAARELGQQANQPAAK